MTGFPTPYRPMTQFVAPALQRAEVWRTICGFVLMLVFGFLAIQILTLGLIAALGLKIAQGLDSALGNGGAPLAVVVILFLYAPIAAGLALSLRLLMRRGLVTLAGPVGDTVRCLLWVALPLVGLWTVLLPLPLLDDGVRVNMTLAQQLPWLPFALLGLLIQTGTEELIFRGYLQQQLAARFRQRWVWMLVPSLLFGLIHYSPAQYGALSWVVVIWSLLFGLAAADLTARTGNLGAAIGLHFANNFAAVLLIGISGNIGELALYNVDLDTSGLSLNILYVAVDGLTLLIGWLAARLILRV